MTITTKQHKDIRLRTTLLRLALLLILIMSGQERVWGQDVLRWNDTPPVTGGDEITINNVTLTLGTSGSITQKNKRNNNLYTIYGGTKPTNDNNGKVPTDNYFLKFRTKKPGHIKVYFFSRETDDSKTRYIYYGYSSDGEVMTKIDRPAMPNNSDSYVEFDMNTSDVYYVHNSGSNTMEFYGFDFIPDDGYYEWDFKTKSNTDITNLSDDATIWKANGSNYDNKTQLSSADYLYAKGQTLFTTTGLKFATSGTGNILINPSANTWIRLAGSAGVTMTIPEAFLKQGKIIETAYTSANATAWRGIYVSSDNAADKNGNKGSSSAGSDTGFNVYGNSSDKIVKLITTASGDVSIKNNEGINMKYLIVRDPLLNFSESSIVVDLNEDINFAELLNNADGLPVTFTSSNSNVTISNATTGVAMAGASAGSATITATYGAYSAAITVQVKAKIAYPVTSGTINMSSSTTLTPTINNATSGARFSSNNNPVATVNETTGEITAHHNGVAIITATDDGVSSTYTVTVTGAPAATATWSVSGDTETYTITGTGDLPREDTGTTIKIGYGNSAEVQEAMTIGGEMAARATDHNSCHFVYAPDGTPTMGSYYAFTPQGVDGKLTARLYMSEVNGIRLTDAAGNVLEKINAANVTANTWFDYKFATGLEDGKTYYLFAEAYTPTDHDNDNDATLSLHSFSFKKASEPYMHFEYDTTPISLNIGEVTFTNRAIVEVDADATVTYSSSDPSVATVDNNGRVTLLSGGIVTITATSQPINGEYTSTSASYTLNINGTRTKWIFNDQSKWVSYESQNLSTSRNPWEGGSYRAITADYVELKNSNSGTIIPEMKGLYFKIDNGNGRIQITTSGDDCKMRWGPEIAMKMTGLSVGQKVTINITRESGFNFTLTNAKDDKGAPLTTTSRTSNGDIVFYASDTEIIVAPDAWVTINSIILGDEVITPKANLSYRYTTIGAGKTEAASWTITDASGNDVSARYNAPTFSSSATGYATVDASGTVTGVAEGTSIITATFEPKTENSSTYATVTAKIQVNVVSTFSEITRTIDISDLLYLTGNSGSSLDRIIPGFELTYTGGNGVKCDEKADRITLCKDAETSGQLTITARKNSGFDGTVTITDVKLYLNSITSGDRLTVKGYEKAAAEGWMTWHNLTSDNFTLAYSGENAAGLTISKIILTYTCNDPLEIQTCLDDELVDINLQFADAYKRRTKDRYTPEAQTNTLVSGRFGAFNHNGFITCSLSNTLDGFSQSYADATGIHTINIGEGTSVVTAKFAGSLYFKPSTATYLAVSYDYEYPIATTLGAGESITVPIAAGLNLAITGKGKTTLTLSNTTDATLTYDDHDNEARLRTKAASDGTVTITNTGSEPLAISTIEVYRNRGIVSIQYPGTISYPNTEIGSGVTLVSRNVGTPTWSIVDEDGNDLIAAGKYKVDSYECSNAAFTFNTSTGELTAPATEASTWVSLNLTVKDESYMPIPLKDRRTMVVAMKLNGAEGRTWDLATYDATAGGKLNRAYWQANATNMNRQDKRAKHISDYEFIINNPDENTAAENDYKNDGLLDLTFGLKTKGNVTFYSNNKYLALFSGDNKASILIPATAGQVLEFDAAGNGDEATFKIDNVTLIEGPEGDEDGQFETGAINEKSTHRYLVTKNGFVTISNNNSALMLYLYRIQLQNQILFKDGENVKDGDVKKVYVYALVESTPTNGYSNEILNANNQTFEYSISGNSDNIVTTAANFVSSGKITSFNKKGTVTITATESGGGRTASYELHVVELDIVKNDLYASLNLAGTEITDDADNLGFKDDLMKNVTTNDAGDDAFKTQMSKHITFEITDNPRQNSNHATISGKTFSAVGTGKVTISVKLGTISKTFYYNISGAEFAQVNPAIPNTTEEYVISMAELYNVNMKYRNITFSIDNTNVRGNLNSNSEVLKITDSNAEANSAKIVGIKAADENMEGTSKGGIIPVTATFDFSDDNGLTWANECTLKTVITVGYTEKTWNFNATGQPLDIAPKNPKEGTSDANTYMDAESRRNLTNPTYNYDAGDGAIWTFEKKIKSENNKDNFVWTYNTNMRGANGLVIHDTEGLQIDNPLHTAGTLPEGDEIVISNGAKLIIPQVPIGTQIDINWVRHTDDQAERLRLTNLCAVDPDRTLITQPYRIAHTGTSGLEDYNGTYSFIVGNSNGAKGTGLLDAVIECLDKCYLRIQKIHLYKPEAVTYKSTMTELKLSEGSEYAIDPSSPYVFLNETEERTIHIVDKVALNANNGPYNFTWSDDCPTMSGLSAVGGDNASLTFKDGWGKMVLTLTNYTQDGLYVSSQKSYTLTFGHPPHQVYPYTWNFENISGGAVKGKSNNAYNSIQGDPYTWKSLGYESYQLDTRTSGGSLYVPGATLVTTDRDLGAMGSIVELNTADQGCDEFNGLGFNGQITFRLASQSGTEPTVSAMKDATNGSLLDYTLDVAKSHEGTNDKGETVIVWDAAGEDGYWEAGDGKIKFGAPTKRERNAASSTGARYTIDSGDTKYLLLKPERPFKEGDKIHFTGFSTNNPLSTGFSFRVIAKKDAPILTSVYWTQNITTEQELTYTVKQGDGIAGRDEVLAYRANTTVYLVKVSITTTDEATPTIPERALTCNGDVTVTIPDLKVTDAGDTKPYYVYIKASAEPTAESLAASHLVAAETADGLDFNTDVYKYKVTAEGNANLTFADGTKIYRIGVTNIMKPLTRVGTGDAWATESRNHAIDYTQTGQFTVNDIKAHTVTAKSYALQRVTVQMNDVDANKVNDTWPAVPAETGLVLKLPLKGADDAATTANINKFATTKSYDDGTGSNPMSGSVPLFYPPYSTPILNSSVVGFGGTQGNLMKDNLTERVLSEETETIGGTEYTRFIFAQRYMKWTKVDSNAPTTTPWTNSGDVPVFYRLHVFSGSPDLDNRADVNALNTLGANKAYMLIRSGNVPEALWKDSSSSAKSFIAIEGVSDMEEITDYTDNANRYNDGRTYNLKGQVVNNDGTLPPGVYIRNGKKVIIK